MPLLLYRYLLRDILRTLLLTTAVLGTVIAFGAAIKPLANDRLLTAAQVAKYMALATVPMLQFALPFSAGFAATITLHRMTIDNEIVAMSAGGLSYRRILTPVVWLGVLLLVLMIGLTQWVIPTFWGLAQRAVATDVTRLFEASISRGEPFRLGNVLIYADEVVVERRADPDGPASRLRLFGVAAAELDEQGRIQTDVTARQAAVDIYREGGRTLIMLALADTVVFNGSMLLRDERVVPERPLVVGDLLEDDPMAMTRWQLLALRENPDAFSEVAEARRVLADALVQGVRLESIRRELEAQGRLVLRQPGDDDATYEVRADTYAGGLFRRRGGAPVEVIALEAGRPLRRFVPARAELDREEGRLDERSLRLVLVEVDVEDLISGRSNRRPEVIVTGLEAPQPLEADELEALDSHALIARAEELPGERAELEGRTRHLAHEITSLRQEIRSRLHKRYALCFTAPLLLLMGATLAMWLRHCLPLTIYLWAFVPSIMALILISGGEQMLRDGKEAGLAVLWSGNAGMAAVLGFAYMKLSRN